MIVFTSMLGSFREVRSFEAGSFREPSKIMAFMLHVDEARVRYPLAVIVNTNSRLDTDVESCDVHSTIAAITKVLWLTPPCIFNLGDGGVVVRMDI